MLITKEQQEKLVDIYIKEKHIQDECIGFIDGINAILILMSKIGQSKIDNKNKNNFFTLDKTKKN